MRGSDNGHEINSQVWEWSLQSLGCVETMKAWAWTSLTALWVAGCATATVPMEYPNNWVTLDGRRVANPQIYYECLKSSRHMTTESQSSFGGGAFGGGTAAVSGSSESRQGMSIDAPLLRACMASKGYRLRDASIETEMGRLPYEVQTPRVRDAWTFEWAKDKQWVGGWTMDVCRDVQRRMIGGATRPASTIPCRPSALSEEPPGTNLWAAQFEKGFVAALNSTDCQTLAKALSQAGAEVPPCRQVWMRVRSGE